MFKKVMFVTIDSFTTEIHKYFAKLVSFTTEIHREFFRVCFLPQSSQSFFTQSFAELNLFRNVF